MSVSISWQQGTPGIWSFGCDFVGQDFANQQVPGSQCSQVCANTPACTHFSWTPASGGTGTCWMKKGPVSINDAVPSTSSGIVCGILAGTTPTKTTSYSVTSYTSSNTIFTSYFTSSSPPVTVTVPSGGAPSSFPPRPTGEPPSTAPNGLLPMPLYVCSSPTTCGWEKTSLVLDDDSFTGIDFPARDVNSFPAGFTMSLRTGSVRLYIVDEAGAKHRPFFLANRVLSIDVDASQIQCGYNGAFYFSEMDLNTPIGRSYCDAQGTCSEMDIIEANIAATQYTSHPCTSKYGTCDHGGCPVNAKNYGLGPGYRGIDSTRPYTVTTTFRTDTGTDSGTVTSIEQVLTQGNSTIRLPAINQGYCSGGPDPQYYASGGLPALSTSFKRGMTMVFSLWGGGGNSMSWLDGGQDNPSCQAGKYASNKVSFSNLVLAYIQ